MTTLDTIIVGGGLSGLTVAHKLRLGDPKHTFIVLEKSGEVGGVIKTHRENGYIAEIGPHGFLDNCEESKAILRETGLDKECVKAPLIDFVRYVLLRDKLQCIPQTPMKISMAPLIPWKDKLRVLAEAWQPVLEGEPTVARWASHRFGSALLPFADAVFTGTYAGDFDRLAIDAVMPGVRALEKEHGSVLRGILAKMRAGKKKRGAKKGKLAMPAMTSFPKGMQRLPERLAEQLGEDQLKLHCPVTSISKEADGWQVQTAGAQYRARNLVLAVPANTALRLLENVADDAPLAAIPEAWIATVVFAFGPGNSLPPGFGYLIPESEQKFTLGSLFTSNMFPGRAPTGHIVFETLVGGRRHPERLELDQEEIIARTLAEVKNILDISGEPVYTTFFKAESPIPQLEKGYIGLLAWRDELVRHAPGLHVCGFGWEGIGLNDMMKTASRVAEAVLDERSDATGAAEVKKIYF